MGSRQDGRTIACYEVDRTMPLMAQVRIGSQPHDILDLREIPVKGTERHMTGFASDLQDQAV